MPFFIVSFVLLAVPVLPRSIRTGGLLNLRFVLMMGAIVLAVRAVFDCANAPLSLVLFLLALFWLGLTLYLLRHMPPPGLSHADQFTAEQLRDPDTAASNQVLRTCVHCGFCTATCPTFLLLGDELDSPRGRIYLIKDMLETGRPATEEVVRHVDRCLSCLACMTTCPSGVNYMHLVDHARSYIEQTYRRPWHERMLRARAGHGAAAAGAVPRWRCSAPGWRGRSARLSPHRGRLGRRLRAMLDLAPGGCRRASPVETPQVHPAQGERRAPRGAAGRLRPAGAGAARSTRRRSGC